jgi:capsular polysaccharide export protein
MIEQDIGTLTGRNVLLLQGPVGPFFARLAEDLRAIGATVHKINFNAGDWFFYPRGAITFRRAMSDWPGFLETVVAEHGIETILLFGDCRPIHQAASALAKARGIELGVFEEGYIRPDYLTFERHGVNANSALPRRPSYYMGKPRLPAPVHAALPNAYWYMALWGFIYFAVGSLGWFAFPRYRHHRPLNLAQGLPWIRSALRRQWYRLGARRQQDRLTNQLNGLFYLVPLQVHNDAQVQVHSAYKNVEGFIEETIASFSRGAPKNTHLVLKHHPMDRGYTHYGRLIDTLARRHGVASRCQYVHDLHMPTLLQHTRGVVVINSVTGLQALQKSVPVKAMGEAVYDMEGLCFQGSLDEFWRVAPRAAPSPRLWSQFMRYLIQRTQINANFYRVRPHAGTATGILWQIRPQRSAGTETGRAASAAKPATSGSVIRSPARAADGERIAVGETLRAPLKPEVPSPMR